MSFSEYETIALPLFAYYACDTSEGVKPAMLRPWSVREDGQRIGECAWTILGREHVRRVAS